jgi:hypothetical protein
VDLLTANDSYVNNTPNPGALKLKTIHQQLTDGVRPDLGFETMGKLATIGDGLDDDLAELSQLVGQLEHIWQAPSARKGRQAIERVHNYVQGLAEHAHGLSNTFTRYLEQVKTAGSHVPPPLPTDDLVESGAGPLVLGPMAVPLAVDLQVRTHEGREIMQQLIEAARAADAGSPPFEPFPDQPVDPKPHDPAPPRIPSGPGGPVLPGTPPPVVPGPDTSTSPPKPAPPTDRSAPPDPRPGPTAGPVQVTSQARATAVANPSLNVVFDSAQGKPTGAGTGVAAPLPGALSGRTNGAPLGRTGSGNPGGGRGLPAPGTGGAAGREALGGRGAAGRGPGMAEAPIAGGGRRSGDEDHEHQRAPFLESGEDADELFGSDQITSPPVIGMDYPQQ